MSKYLGKICVTAEKGQILNQFAEAQVITFDIGYIGLHVYSNMHSTIHKLSFQIVWITKLTSP